MHFQWPPSREGKLVRCLRGGVLRRAAGPSARSRRPILGTSRCSSTKTNRDAVFIPHGIAHGFQTLVGFDRSAVSDDRCLRPGFGDRRPLERPGLRIEWPMASWDRDIGARCALPGFRSPDIRGRARAPSRSSAVDSAAWRSTFRSGRLERTTRHERAVEQRPGAELHAFASRLYPICRSITGQRRAANARHDSRARFRSRFGKFPVAARSTTGKCRWNGTSRMPPSWLPTANASSISRSTICTSSATRNRSPRRCRWTSSSSGCTRCPSIRRGSRIGRATTGAAGDSASRTTTRQALRAGQVPGRDQELAGSRGSLTYGELAIPGRTREEVLFFTHVCHPSLANDNTSGMAVATALCRMDRLRAPALQLSLRLRTGDDRLAVLAEAERAAPRAEFARVSYSASSATQGALTYKTSRNADAETDAIARYVLSQIDPSGIGHSVLALRLRRAAAVLARIRSPGRATHALGQRRLSPSTTPRRTISRSSGPQCLEAEPRGVQAVRDHPRGRPPLRQPEPEGRAAARQARALRRGRRHGPSASASMQCCGCSTSPTDRSRFWTSPGAPDYPSACCGRPAVALEEAGLLAARSQLAARVRALERCPRGDAPRPRLAAKGTKVAQRAESPAQRRASDEGCPLLRGLGHAVARALGRRFRSRWSMSAFGRSSGISCATTRTTATRNSFSAWAIAAI